MGTIAEKLTYLNTTKIKLRDSLNKFGSSILSTDTFRSYDTKLNEIYDKLPKITSTGQGLTITDVQNGLLDDFKMIGTDLEQNTTNGNQLVNFGSPTTGNPLITLSFNNEILTLTGESGQYVGIQYDLYNVITNSNNAGKTIKFGYKSISNITGSGSIAQINIYYKDSTPNIYRSLINRQGSISSTYTIPNDTSNIRSAALVLYTNNGSPASTGSVTIEEPLAYFDNNNTYEPYTNGASPNPDYPQQIKVVEGRQTITDKGKNLLNTRTVNGTQNGITISYDETTHIYTFNGTCTQDNTLFMLSDKSINFIAGVTKSITYWVDGSCANYCYMRHYNPGYSLGCIYPILELSENNPKIVTTSQSTFLNPANLTSIRFNNGSVATNFKIKVMVTDDDNTDYEPYYEPVSYNIDLHGKNVFDLEKYPFTSKVAYSSTGYQELNWTGYSGIKDYFPVNGNTTYSFSNSTGLDIYYGLVFYDKNKTIISNITAHTTTFTTPSNCEYIRFSIHTEELPTWVQIEEGSTTTNYEEYYDYKLAKIPNTDYKNRIYKNNGNWYFEENVKRVVLDGSENWGYGNITNVFYTTSITNYAINNNIPLSNYYTGISNVSGASDMGSKNNNTISFINVSGENTPRFYIKDTRYTSASDTSNLKTWLSSNNLEMWYILDNSVTTQITNTTLINQLEVISVHTGTNIITISNSNNIIPEIEITRLKELEKLA